MGPVRIGLLGAGIMGTHHARLIAESPRATLHVVVDRHVERAEALARRAGAAASADPSSALDADAVIVATPTETHLGHALPLLEAGRPLLIEKPIAPDLPSVRRLLKESEARDVPVACGFVERFNPAIAAARSILEEPVLHINAVRHSPSTPRMTTSVVFDLLIHDIDLTFLYVDDHHVLDLHAVTTAPDGAGVTEIADCTIRFASGTIATLSSSRASQRKIRSLSVATPSVLAELDLLRATVSVYRHVRQEQITDRGTTYRAETIVDIPFVRHAGEPLALQLDHFLDLVEGVADPDAERRGLLPPHEVAARVAGTEA
jgi:predicted dehydrogenase